MTATPRGGDVTTLVPRARLPAFNRPLAVSKSKLVPPRAPARVVAAERYREWLEPVLAHDVTLVGGPPACGKTVFAGQIYLAMSEAGRGAGWVSCDCAREGIRIADYIVAAVRRAISDSEEASRFQSPPASLAIDLANAVYDHRAPVLICLDDVDRIADGENAEFLARLIDNCPTNLHLLLTSRDARALPQRWVGGHGTILRLDGRVLRASDTEAAEYLASEGVSMSSQQIGALNAVLAGWWGGLREAAGSLRGATWNSGPDEWQRRCAQWVGPLLSESLAALPEGRRSLLTRCAVAATLTPEFAVHLLGDDGAGETLRDLALDGHFVEAVSGTVDRYRLHPALPGALTGADPALVAVLRRRAIDWHVGRGEFDDAISIASRDADSLAALLAEIGLAAIERAGPQQAWSVIERLPPDRVAGDAKLTRVAAWAGLLTGRAATPSEFDISHLAKAEIEALERIRAFVHPQDAPLEPLDAPPSADFTGRLLGAWHARAALHGGDHKQSLALLRPVIRHGRQAGTGFAEAIAFVTMADLHRAQGRPDYAERVVQEALSRLATGAGQGSDSAALLSIALADIHYLRNDLAAAGALVDEFLPVLARTGVAGVLLRGYRLAIRLAVAASCGEDAISLIEQAEELADDRGFRPLQAMGAVERMRQRVPLVTELEEILPVAAEEAAIAAPGSIAARTFAILSEARAFEAIGNLDRPHLTQVADRLLALAARAQDTELKIIGTVFHVLPQLSGRCDRMVEIETVRFLNSVAGMGFVRPMVDLLQITGVRTSQDFDRGAYSAGSFLALLRLSQPSGQDARSDEYKGAGPAFSFFTAREMEIVSSLSERETNKMIARRLGVAPETVKWHMKSLMRKLRANSRDEIVRNALTLGVSLNAGER